MDSTSLVETSTRVEGRVFTHNVEWVPGHLKHPLKTIDQYRSPVSDHDRAWGRTGCHDPPGTYVRGGL